MFGSLAQAAAHRIHFDITHLFSHLIRATQPMIEKVSLPIDFVKACEVAFPILDCGAHTAIGREVDNAVNMIRHEQQNAASPCIHIVVVSGGSEDCIAQDRATQMVLAGWIAINCNKEITV